MLIGRPSWIKMQGKWSSISRSMPDFFDITPRNALRNRPSFAPTVPTPEPGPGRCNGWRGPETPPSQWRMCTPGTSSAPSSGFPREGLSLWTNAGETMARRPGGGRRWASARRWRNSALCEVPAGSSQQKIPGHRKAAVALRCPVLYNAFECAPEAVRGTVPGYRPFPRKKSASIPGPT